jgi:O-antigen biosynthesis protein
MDAKTVKRSGKKQAQLTSPASGGLRTAFFRSGERRFSGYVMDPADPSRKFSVEILVDGYPVRVIRADAFVHELIEKQIGDGYYGFSYSLQDAAVSDSAVVEARLANLGTAVGMPIALARPSDKVPQISGPATVRWLGGLRFSGWIAGREGSAIANVHVDGTLITRVRASAWSHVGTSEDDARAVRAFDFHLPERFADGGVHQLALLDDLGENIGGNPLSFMTYPDGLCEAVAGRGVSDEERLRAQLFDQLLPMSVPFSQYQSWRERFPILSGPSRALRGAVITVGPGAMDDTLESLHEQTHDDWIAASLPQTSEPTGLQADLARAFLENDGADCEFVVFALAGTLFAPSALQRIAGAFTEYQNALAVYADLDLQSDDGSVWPLAFPAFDYERMLEQGYCAYLFALRRSCAARLLKVGASNLYRLFNSVLDDGSTSHSDIVHLPGPLGTLPGFDKTAAGAALAAAGSAHLQHKGIKVHVTQRPGGVLPAVQITRTFERSRTTIIIPTLNRQSFLQACIESIRPAVERTDAEILVVDNDSADPDTLGYLAELENRGATVLRVPGELNFPRLINYAAKAAQGELLCLLNNDVKALDDHWLEEMQSRIAEGNVGAVGALLVWPSGVVQHGGIVLGPSFAAAHAFNDRIDSDVGYGDLLRVAHECSAVTAACLVTRRRDYLAVGGMDEVRFPVNFNDVDYCLKLRALGKRIVFTPHAKLTHFESASRGSDIKANNEARFERELQNLRAKWGSVLAADPYYSPMLSLDPIPFSALAWPVRAMEPRVNNLPLSTQIPPGF